jgi:hemolysin activation/secretion protein
MKKLLSALLVLLLAVFFSVQSYGQSSPSRPSDLDILDRERASRPPDPRSQPIISVREDETGIPVFDESLRFTLSEIVVEGATVFTQEELLSPYRQLIGQMVSFNEMLEIAEEMSIKYRDAGYVLSKVVLPAQRVDSVISSVKLVALEGYIESMTWVGEDKLVKKASAWFDGHERKLLEQRPLRHSDFERAVTLLSDAKACSVSTTFNPGVNPSGSILVIEISAKPVEGSLTLNSSGTSSAGPWMAGFNLGFYTFPLFGSSTSLSFNQTTDIEEYFNVYFAHTYQWASGWWVTASYSYSASQKPDNEFSRLFEQSNKSNSLSFGLGYSVIRSRERNLSLEMTYNQRDGTDYMFDTVNTKDRLRSLTWNLNYDFADDGGGVTQLIPSFVQGLNLFNATDRDPESSGPLAPASYSKGLLYVSHGRPLFGPLSFFVSAQLQLSGTILPNYEEFSLGGGIYGRGYDSGVLSSDNGLAGSLELRMHKPLSESAYLQPFAFVDWGTVWTNGNIDGVDPHSELSSLGLGFRLSGSSELLFPSNFNLTAYMGKPLQTINGKSSPRYILMASAGF